MSVTRKKKATRGKTSVKRKPAAKKGATAAARKALAAKKKAAAAKKKAAAAKKKKPAAKKKAAAKKKPAAKKKAAAKKKPAAKKKKPAAKKKKPAAKKKAAAKKKPAAKKKKPAAKKKAAAKKKTAPTPKPAAVFPDSMGVPTPLSDEEPTHRVSTELAEDVFSPTAGETDSASDHDDDIGLWGQGGNDQATDTGGQVQGSWVKGGDDDPDKTAVFSRAGTDVEDDSWEEPPPRTTETSKNEHSFELPASPQEVYDAYMDDDKHSELTGKPAQIERYVGGHMEVLDGEVIGDFIELEDGSRIVQTWRSSMWPEVAEPSMLTLTFEQTDDGTGTKIAMVQDDVPVDQADANRDLWEEYYWEPLKRRFS